MSYLKATIVGIGLGLLLAVVTLFLLQLVITFMTYVDGEGALSGGDVSTLPIVLAAALGFVTGFYWTLRRAGRGWR